MKNLDFGEKLIEIRKLRGLTQVEVAEKRNVTTRTIQRIESGIVKPRASTIKIICQTLGFDFFETSNTGFDAKHENQTSKLKNHTFLWYLKDLFNLKTNTMKKISVMSASILLVVFLCFNMLNSKAQSGNVKKQESLIIQLNEDKSVKRVEAAFTNSLTLDSLVQIKQALQDIGIVIHYKMIEFDVNNALKNLDCQVICNDGYSGSFTVTMLDKQNKNIRVGFFRDYSLDSMTPFGTGVIDNE